MDEIHPCACGATDAAPVLDRGEDALWHARVECPDCETLGPTVHSVDPDAAEVRAIAAWNSERTYGGGGSAA